MTNPRLQALVRNLHLQIKPRIAPYSDELLVAKERHRIRCSEGYMHESVRGFWDTVYFTAEAHSNPTETFQ